MNAELTYATIREEILAQKKCQFQIFGAAAAMTSAVLAYAGAQKIGGLIYIAPMLFNHLALWMVLDKAISVQRKVGYLQFMERHNDWNEWAWESDLDAFRADPATGEGARESRKHTYVTIVCTLLLSLSAFCLLLYFFGPSAPAPTSQSDGRVLGWIDGACIALFAASFVVAGMKRHSLVRGKNSTAAIQKKWARVIKRPAKKQGKAEKKDVRVEGDSEG